MTLFVSPVTRATDANDNPLSGAKWYFYATQTLTPIQSFTTADLTTPHPHPVVADSAGLFPPIYLDPAVVTRGILKDANDVTLADYDPINGDTAVAGPVSARTFGAVGDGVINDYAAFVALQTYLGTLSRTGYGYNVGIPSALVPFGVYYFGGNAFDIIYPIRWIAEGNGGATDAATVLKWNNTSSGLRVQYVDTTGDSGTQAASTHSGSGAIFEGFHLDGGFTNGVEAERHAVHARAKVLLRDCNFFNWAGDAIHVDATTVGAHKGNANLTKAENCWAENCRNGWTCEGNDDTNAGHLIGFSANGCRRWGILESSFLGNQIIGGHFDSNARQSWNSGAADHPCSYVYQTGNFYFAIHGQETGASTNAPSGTTADNTWWGWWQAAGAASPTTGVPQWTSGIAVRSGGPICVAGVSNATTIAPSPHIETNGVSQIDQLTAWWGGNSPSADAVRVSAGVLNRDRANRISATTDGLIAGGTFRVKGALYGDGATNVIGPNKGATVQDGITYLGTRSTAHTLSFGVYDSAGAPGATIGTIAATSAAGMVLNLPNAAHSYFLEIAGNILFTFDTAGLHVAAAIKSSSATAGVGYETGAGGAVTQATSKSTATPTINKACGQVTMNNAALAAGAKVSFVVTNNTVAATDTIIVSVASGGTANAYRAAVTAVAAGSGFTVTVENITAGSLSEAPVVNFAIIKAVAA